MPLCFAKLKTVRRREWPSSRSRVAVISASSSVSACAAISPVGATIAEPPIIGKPSSAPHLAGFPGSACRARNAVDLGLIGHPPARDRRLHCDDERRHRHLGHIYNALPAGRDTTRRLAIDDLGPPPIIGPE